MGSQNLHKPACVRVYVYICIHVAGTHLQWPFLINLYADSLAEARVQKTSRPSATDSVSGTMRSHCTTSHVGLSLLGFGWPGVFDTGSIALETMS